MSTPALPGTAIDESIEAELRPLITPPVRRQRSFGMTIFTAPALLWYAVFMIGPLVAMFGISLFKWPGLIGKRTFVGFANYGQVLSDPVFYAALRNTIVQVVIVVPIMIPLAFMLGYYLQLKRPGHRVLSVLCFTPGLISISAKALVFVGVFAPNGLINGVLNTLGLADLATPWLANTSTALATIIIVDLWSGIGWTAVLFAARLASVSPEVYEASDLDGCGHWRRMWLIAFPICKEYFGVMVMLQFLWTLFTSAALVLLLTKGGPGTSSTTLSYLVYAKAFQQQQVGYSQAVGVLLFGIGLIGMFIIRRSIRQNY
jgi:ABC-type sugar transport system permease subunit